MSLGSLLLTIPNRCCDSPSSRRNRGTYDSKTVIALLLASSTPALVSFTLGTLPYTQSESHHSTISFDGNKDTFKDKYYQESKVDFFSLDSSRWIQSVNSFDNRAINSRTDNSDDSVAASPEQQQLMLYWNDLQQQQPQEKEHQQQQQQQRIDKTELMLKHKHYEEQNLLSRYVDSFEMLHLERYEQLKKNNSKHATIERSLMEIYHIQLQLDWLTEQSQTETKLVSSFASLPIHHNHNQKQQQQQQESEHLHHFGDSLGRIKKTITFSRQLEDAFSGLYTNTYGTNMFCGVSWAEASSSCETRQNCPSGQNDECIIAGQQCWAFTECDTRYGHGAQFSAMHGVTGGQNLEATGIGANVTGGFVDLSKPSPDPKDHYFCGKGYDDAIGKCLTNCPSGNLNDCPEGEICFLNTPCDARLLTKAPSPPSPTTSPTTPAPVTYESKLNKYYCGYDWTDAQERCEIWCPSGSDDDCPEDQLCFAFSKCNAVDMNGITLDQMEKNQTQNNNNGTSVNGSTSVNEGDPGDENSGRIPTSRPTPKPVVSAEVAMHRNSFCGAFWSDARDNCDTKQHCEDDKDCPEFEFCWTQTPCDFLATEPPSPSPPTKTPTIKPKKGKPTSYPTSSPIGPPTKTPTPLPTTKPTPTYAPTVTFKPTDLPSKPPVDKNDPSKSWAHADETCMVRCSSGNSNECPGDLECWAFTSCKKEKGYVTGTPTVTPSLSPIVIYIPGFGGEQVSVFGGQKNQVISPTVSPHPTSSSFPSLIPTLPPGVIAKQTLSSYYCGIDWNDVVKNCHQPCPSGQTSECENPEHSCWAFVEACRARSKVPSDSPITKSSSFSPIILAPTRDPSSPMTPYPTDRPTDLYGLLASQKLGFYCANTWDDISCGESTPCPSGNDDDCPSEESCYQSTIDCSKPQLSLVESSAPVTPLQDTESFMTLPPSQPSRSNEVDNEGEDWASSLTNTNSEGGDGLSSLIKTEVDNEGETWGKREPTRKPTPRGPTLDPTQVPTIDLLDRLEQLKKAMYCSKQWDTIDCETAQSCPSGDDKECPKGQRCFSGANCRKSDDEEPDPIETDNVTSKFFCGTSWETVVENCDSAVACPSGTNAECPPEEQCFADTPCESLTSKEDGSNISLNFATMVNIPMYCEDQRTMSKNVAYWQSWSIYRNDTCNPFTPESIDASSYTHVVYAFAAISSYSTLEAWDFEEDIKGGLYKDFLALKNRYPSVKLVLAVGGWTHNDPDNERLYRFSVTSSNPKARMKFAQSSVAFLRKYGFDGLDLDWEYPGDEERGGNITFDKDNYALLCEELRKYFDQAPEKFELSVAIPVSIERLKDGFDLEKMAKSVDFFNVMAYDIHGVWDDPPIIGAHSDVRVINSTINYMMTNSSVPASQIVLGLAAYGRSYTISNKTCVSLGCPFEKDSNETAIGGCLDTKGFVPYVEIHQWTEEGEGVGYNSIQMDTASFSAVMVKDKNQLISYDNPETFKSKVDFASNICLGGTMVWAIDMIPAASNTGGSNSTNIITSNSSGSQSILDEESANQAYCGITWDTAVSLCKTPCPSGSSDDCAEGETCFAGVTCGEAGGGGKLNSNTCKICPDPTKQGIKSWVNVEIEINGTTKSTTCGNIDNDVFSTVPKSSKACDTAQLSLSKDCCYDYPENQCWLCQKDLVHFSIRSDHNVTLSDNSVASCYLVDKMLAPEEATSTKCITTRDALFSDCCYSQCSFCEGLGLKWWIEFDGSSIDSPQMGNTSNATESLTSENKTTCSSIDASLYADFIEDGSDQCATIKSKYAPDCCFEYPTNPCSICQKDDSIFTLLWASIVENDGKNVTCGIIDNMLNAESNDTQICRLTKEKHFDNCCFDKCNLCGQKQLAWDYIIDTDTAKTCGQIEADLTANEVNANSAKCTETKSEFQSICCYIMPKAPCEICDEYVRWDNQVQFDDAQFSCKEVTDMVRREENSSEKCSATRKNLESTCCYELCDICGKDLVLDWDMVVEYDGEQMSCGDFKPFFGKHEIENSSKNCSTISDSYRSLCCYSQPITPCNLCQAETEYLEAYSNVAVDFWGTASNCTDVYDYLIRKIESDSTTCSSAKDSVSSDCCYKKCSICNESQIKDLTAQVIFDGTNISCLQLHTVTTVDVSNDSQDCLNVRSQFSESCCYDAPKKPCILCEQGAVRKDTKVDFSGKTETCETVANFIGSRVSNGTEECMSSQEALTEYCCFDKCTLCKNNDEVDWDSSVEFEGEMGFSCGNFDWYFTSNEMEESTAQCQDLQNKYSEKCCYAPIDYSIPACSLCKKDDFWYEINGPFIVDYDGESRACTDVSNSLFRKTEDGSDICNSAKTELFESCCFQKCNICTGAQMDTSVEVIYNNTATTCLDIGLNFATRVIKEGSDECSKAKNLLFEACCYNIPTDPCILCKSSIGQGDIRDKSSVTFYGAATTCMELNSFLVSREEQVSFMCQAAKTELQDSCCYHKCSICGENGTLYWDNPVEFNGLTFACGELTWIIDGSIVEEGSEECKKMQSEHFDACCKNVSPDILGAGNKCEICPSAKDWYAQVTYDGNQMTCLELDSALLKNRVVNDSIECKQVKQEYSGLCCYTPPKSPCNLCLIGQKSYSILDKNITYNGAQNDCYGVYNHLITRVESQENICLIAQHDLFETCCFDKCSLCQDYQLNPDVTVNHEGTSIGCFEIETNLFSMNEIKKGTDQCTQIQQKHFNECCYDIPCDLCEAKDSEYDLLMEKNILYQGRNQTCGDVSVHLEADMSQSDKCISAKENLFESCCFKQCGLCRGIGMAVNWNHELTYEGLASTCIDVYTSLLSERIKEGDDKCESIQFTVSPECCYELPNNQCALCLDSNGTFLNTNWNNQVVYQGATMTCSDVNAILSSEELDSITCLTARDSLWKNCCLPHQSGNMSDVFASDKKQGGSIAYNNTDSHGLPTLFIQNDAKILFRYTLIEYLSIVLIFVCLQYIIGVR